MTDVDTRTVGERGQVTIPKQLREAFGIQGGDEVTIREEDGKIVIETPVSRSELAAGYRNRADQHREITEAFAGVSQEANSQLGEPPRWEE